jgi:hypothetical protein
MKPEQQIIAIAEADGWRRRGRDIWDNAPFSPQKLLEPPDYLNDLNAMHKAEKRIFTTPTERTQYYWQLLNVIGRYTSPDEAISATAAQRAEAFLRTIGKWTGQPTYEQIY